MNDLERARLAMLRDNGLVTPDYLPAFYGLQWPWTGEVGQDFSSWLGRSSHEDRWNEDRPSRYVIEKFLQDQRIEPKKWVACQLGMKETSLDSVFENLSRIGLRRHRYEVYPGLISTSFAKDLDAHLKRLKFRTFSDNNTYCEFLHTELGSELGVTVEPEFCATSTVLGDNPRWYARTFDCITLEPLSVRHQMFLDFGKPLYLRFDVCSKHFYATNRAILQPYHAGSQEPADLAEYEAAAHA